jgi:hypothetical protein
MNLVPSPDNYDSIIDAATLRVQEDNIFWSPVREWYLYRPDRDECTWITAKKLKWREVDWLGDRLRYGPNEI